MVIDVNSKTKADFFHNFKERVTLTESFYGQNRMKQRDKYVGYIDGDQFWLARTKKSFSLTSCRRFCGRVIEDSDETFVQGEFKIDRAFLMIIVLFVFGTNIFYLLYKPDFFHIFRDGIDATIYFSFVFALDVLYISILHLMDKFYNAEYSKAIVEFIKEL